MDILHANILFGRDRRRDGHEGHSQLFLPWWRRWLLLGRVLAVLTSCWSDGWGRPQFSQKVAHFSRRWYRRPPSQAYSRGAHRLALGSSLLLTRTACTAITTTRTRTIGIRIRTRRLLGIAAAAALLIAGEPIEDLGRQDGAEGEEAAALLADSTSGGGRRGRRRRSRAGCRLDARGRPVAVAVAAAVTTEQVHYVAVRTTTV